MRVAFNGLFRAAYDNGVPTKYGYVHQNCHLFRRAINYAAPTTREWVPV